MQQYNSTQIQKAKRVKHNKIYRAVRKAKDPSYRILCALRSRVGSAVVCDRKSALATKLVGCDIGFLRRWIEAKWKPGMTWENHGVNGWHIDHIMPCASFDLSDPQQQRICFRWTNLQPLWAHENRQKSDKIL